MAGLDLVRARPAGLAELDEGAAWPHDVGLQGGLGGVRDKTDKNWIKLFMAHGVSGHQTILHPVFDSLSNILRIFLNKLPQ